LICPSWLSILQTNSGSLFSRETFLPIDEDGVFGGVEVPGIQGLAFTFPSKDTNLAIPADTLLHDIEEALREDPVTVAG
jgi:hypothetical protein